MSVAGQDLLNGNYPSSTPKYSHSIHVSINNTSFIAEDVSGAIILNNGGSLLLSGVTYANNTAESIVKSEYSTLAMTSTKFSTNEILGDAGVIVLDSKSKLEANDGNCDAVAPIMSFGCGGIEFGGICVGFESCDALTSGNEVAIPGVDEVGVEEEEVETCFSDWDTLVVSVRDRPNKETDFIICPGAALAVTSLPVVISASGITIQCGNPESQSKNCFVSGGYSHFQVEGSASKVQLARLTLSASTGSSIMALGTADSSLTVRDCEFITNEGSSVIVINNGQSMASSSIESATAAAAAAMSVEVINCTFARNELSFGTISNIGGTLSVYNSRFVENSGNGGNIVVMKRGACNVQGCCFESSSSVAPGTIFIEEGSVMMGNEKNFGSKNTAGGYGVDTTCFDIFHEAKDGGCLGDGSSPEKECSGSCKEFTSSICTLGGTGENSAANDDKISVPAFNKEGGSLSSKVVPITVATIVCLLIVFGLVGIVLRRRKVSNGRGGGIRQRRSTNRREYGGIDDEYD